MDKKDAIILVQQSAAAIHSKFDFNRMILFGSYAKGNFHEDSDIDIAVIFEDYSNRLDMQLELMRLRRKIDSRIEPYPFRYSEFVSSNPLVYEILKHGQEIKQQVA